MSRASLRELQPQSLPRSISSQPSRIPGFGRLFDRLGACECRRRVLHMLPGLLPSLLLVIPHRDPWGPLLIGIVVVTALATITYALTRETDFARPNESLWHISVIGYSVPVLAMLILLPGHAELGLMTLGVLAFGDGSAALGGKLFGGRRLPWNHRKTWAGLFCFLGAGTTVASFNYWLDSHPAVPVSVAVMIAGTASLAGAIVESLPIRSHDNFRVGVTAALTGMFMHMFILGW